MKRIFDVKIGNKLGDNCPKCNHPSFVSDDYCSNCGERLN